MPDIAYQVRAALYLNITNRCTNQCSFCIRNKSRLFNKKYALWLQREPPAKEVLAAIGDPGQYGQIVFCGYGEPLIRLDVVKTVAAELKSKINPKSKIPAIRIDTNGQANLFWGRNIAPELKGLIDIISISLDAENAEVYRQICRPSFGPKAYPAIIEFAKECKKYIPQVELSVVDLPAVDKNKSKAIAKKLGAAFRLRSYYEKSYVR